MEQQVTNPYFELGVKPGVSPKQLKQAYRQSVLRYHPDTAAGKGNAKKISAGNRSLSAAAENECL